MERHLEKKLCILEVVKKTFLTKPELEKKNIFCVMGVADLMSREYEPGQQQELATKLQDTLTEMANLTDVESVTWATLITPNVEELKKDASLINEIMVSWIRTQDKINHLNLRPVLINQLLNPTQERIDKNQILSEKEIEEVTEAINTWFFDVMGYEANDLMILKQELKRERKNSKKVERLPINRPNITPDSLNNRHQPSSSTFQVSYDRPHTYSRGGQRNQNREPPSGQDLKISKQPVGDVDMDQKHWNMLSWNVKT